MPSQGSLDLLLVGTDSRPRCVAGMAYGVEHPHPPHGTSPSLPQSNWRCGHRRMADASGPTRASTLAS